MLRKASVHMAHFGLIRTAWWLLGCSPLAGTWEFKEVQRIRSPDGKAEAVLLKGDAGTTTSTTTLVMIVASGEKVKTKDLLPKDTVFWATHLKNFNLVWKESSLLEFQYDEARIDHFRNLKSFLGDDKMYYAVEIRLAPKNSTFSVSSQDRMPIPVH